MNKKQKKITHTQKKEDKTNKEETHNMKNKTITHTHTKERT